MLQPAARTLPLDDTALWQQGFHAVETSHEQQQFRWSSGHATLQVPFQSSGHNLMMLRLQSGRTDHAPVPLHIQTASQHLTFTVTPDERCYRFWVDVPWSLSPHTLRLTTTPFQVPGDQRMLGIVITGITIAPAGSGIPWWAGTMGLLLLHLFCVLAMFRGTVWREWRWVAVLVATLWLPLHLPWLLHQGSASQASQRALAVAVLLATTTAAFYATPLLSLPIRRGVQWLWRAQTVLSDEQRLVGTLVVVYSAVILLLPGQITITGDEPHYLLKTYSIIHDHDFNTVNNYRNEDYRHFHSDLLLPHIVNYKGRILPFLHPMAALPVLLVPGYLLAGVTGVLLSMSIIMATAMLFLYRCMLAYVPRQPATLVVLLTGLTYPVIIYSQEIMTETVAFAIVAFALSQIIHPPQRYHALRAGAIGAALALLPHLHYKLGALSVTLYLFFLWKERMHWRTMLPASIAPALSMAALFVLWLRHLFGEFSLDIFTTPTAGRFWQSGLSGVPGLWFDQEYGLFFFAPFYLLALPGLWLLIQAPRTRTDALFLAGIYGSFHFLSGSFWDWDGGLGAVPRYLVPALPVLIVASTRATAELWQRRQWLQIVLLALLNIIITLMVLVKRPLMYGFELGSNAILREIFHAHTLITWLPSFRTATDGRPYVLLVLLLALLGCTWYLCTAGNRLLARFVPVHGQHSLVDRMRSTESNE